METIYKDRRSTFTVETNSDTGQRGTHSDEYSVYEKEQIKQMHNCKDLFKRLIEVSSSKTQTIRLTSRILSDALPLVAEEDEIVIDLSLLERENNNVVLNLKGDPVDPRKRVSCGIHFVIDSKDGPHLGQQLGSDSDLRLCIDLSHNFIRHITFDQSIAQHVKTLNLSSNNLEELNVSELINLENLNVSENVPDHVNYTTSKEITEKTENVNDMEVLDLSKNKQLKTLSVLNVGFRDVVIPRTETLEKLEVVFTGSCKHLINTDLHFLTSIKYLHIENGVVDELLITSATSKLETLILRGVDLSKFCIESTLILSTLVYLDLSNNNVEYIDLSSAHCLKHLDVTKNKINKLDVSQNQNLEILRASQCCLTFLRIPSTIKVLDVASNYLTDIELQEGERLINLTHLDIGSNNITQIDTSYCRNLMKLVLNNNKFDFFSNILLPESTQKLEYINFSNNPLKLSNLDVVISITDVNLEKYSELNEIIVTNCFTDATGSFTAPTKNLRKLVIINTNFTNVLFTDSSFDRCADLDLVVRENVNLKKIDFTLISDVTNSLTSSLPLHSLDLSDNPALSELFSNKLIVIKPRNLTLSSLAIESFRYDRKSVDKANDTVDNTKNQQKQHKCDTLEVVRSNGVKYLFDVTNLINIDMSRNADKERSNTKNGPIDFAWLSKVPSIKKITIDDPYNAALLFPGSYSVKNIKFNVVRDYNTIDSCQDDRSDSSLDSDLTVSIIQSTHNNTNFIVKYSGLPGGDGGDDYDNCDYGGENSQDSKNGSSQIESIVNSSMWRKINKRYNIKHVVYFLFLVGFIIFVAILTILVRTWL